MCCTSCCTRQLTADQKWPLELSGNQRQHLLSCMNTMKLSTSLSAGSALQRCCTGICRSQIPVAGSARTARSITTPAAVPPTSSSSCVLALGAGKLRQRLLHRSVSTAAYSSAAGSTGDAPRVCILGGGFGGLYTAVKLESLLWPKGNKPKVTLIDQSERFVFKPLLYELLNGTALAEEVAPSFTQLLAPYPIQFIQDRVAGVEPDAQLRDGSSVSGGSVVLASGERVPYDWLVVALGAEPDPRGVPGVKEHARPFAALEDALWVNERLADLEAGSGAGEVVVVGGGYAGVELAAVLGERLLGGPAAGRCRVTLVTPGDGVLEGCAEGQRAAAQEALSKLNVEVLTNTRVTRLSPPVIPDSPSTSASGTTSSSSMSSGNGDAWQDPQQQQQTRPGHCLVYLEPRSSSSGASSSGASSSGVPPSSVLEADMVLWTAGAAPVSKFIQGLPFPSNSRGALETDSTLQVHANPRVFALGDVAGAMGSADPAAAASGYPATAQVAFQQADYAAWNIWAAMNGRPLLPFRYQHLGSMMSLGATNAAVAVPLELPEALTSAITSSPLGPLLNMVGVKLQQGVVLEGPLAQLLRRAAYLYRQPTNEQRLSVAASWMTQAAELSAKLGAGLAATSRGGREV